MAVEEFDELVQYCRTLGHAVPFGYCRALPEDRPCRLIADCWHERFDVAAFLQSHYSAEQIEAFLAPPRPKLMTILEMIERARAANP